MSDCVVTLRRPCCLKRLMKDHAVGGRLVQRSRSIGDERRRVPLQHFEVDQETYRSDTQPIYAHGKRVVATRTPVALSSRAALATNRGALDSSAERPGRCLSAHDSLYVLQTICILSQTSSSRQQLHIVSKRRSCCNQPNASRTRITDLRGCQEPIVLLEIRRP